jgi:hypothetical protein
MNSNAYCGFNEKRGEFFYYCPFCKNKVYDIWNGCRHIVYIYNNMDQEPYGNYPLLQDVVKHLVENDPSSFLENYDDLHEQGLSLEDIIEQSLSIRDIKLLYEKTDLRKIAPNLECAEHPDNGGCTYLLASIQEQTGMLALIDNGTETNSISETII